MEKQGWEPPAIVRKSGEAGMDGVMVSEVSDHVS